MEALIDSLKLVPFLFLTYLLMDLIENKAGDKTRSMIKRAGKSGPFFGSLLGVCPQCGFSAAASGFYAGRVITLGTLISIYLSTSDEMLPILISEAVPISTMLKIIGTKVFIGMVTGFIIELVGLVAVKQDKSRPADDGILATGGCGCCSNHSYLKSALSHTVKVFLIIFAISFVVDMIIEHGGEDVLTGVLVDIPLLGEFLAALVGLIPNCAGSVIITELYLDGIISAGAMMSGLLVSAGVGVLVLFMANKNIKKNISIMALLYFVSVAWGILIEFTGIVF